MNENTIKSYNLYNLPDNILDYLWDLSLKNLCSYMKATVSSFRNLPRDLITINKIFYYMCKNNFILSPSRKPAQFSHLHVYRGS